MNYYILGFLESIVENIDKTIKQIEESIDDISKNKKDNSGDKNDGQNASEFEQQKEKLNAFVTRVQSLKSLSQTFHFEIDDPSGNSYVENPNAPHRDEQLTVKDYRRTSEQDALLGISEETEEENTATTTENEDNSKLEDSLKDEVLMFATNCPNCNAPCSTNMKLTQIPYFKEVIIMATSCDICGNKSNEVKSGSGVAPAGIRYKLVMNDAADLDRDILVSETASFAIPDLDFELSSSKSIGGRFTTLEGIFTTLTTQLASVIMPFSGGDSRAANSDENHMKKFIDHISAVLDGKEFVTIVLDDPAGNCYVQNLYAPDPDPQLTIEHYKRSEDQDELLGLIDMKVENYEES